MTSRGGVLVAHQPAYLPWPGYLSRLSEVDTFVVLDHVQFAERGWQHRNYVRAAHGNAIRMTVPVERHFGQPLNRVRIAGQHWRARHWRTLRECYAQSAHWPLYGESLQTIYTRSWVRLVDLNLALIKFLLDGFGMHPTFVSTADLQPAGAKTTLLLELCRRTGTDVLRVGEGAISYIDGAMLAAEGIAVQIAAYNPAFSERPRDASIAAFSAIDLLLRHGPRARTRLLEGSSLRRWSPDQRVTA